MTKKEERAYFTDHYNYVFLFHKKYQGSKYSDKEWSEILAEAETIWNKFNKDLHVLELLCAALEEIERHCGHKNMWNTQKFLEVHLRAIYGAKDNKELGEKLINGG